MTARNIFWAYWPFSSGVFADLRIFWSNLRNKILPHENVIADQGYSDSMCSNDEMKDGSVDFKYIWARREAKNKRPKQLSVLGSRFRHKPDLHKE